MSIKNYLKRVQVEEPKKKVAEAVEQVVTESKAGKAKEAATMEAVPHFHGASEDVSETHHRHLESLKKHHPERFAQLQNWD